MKKLKKSAETALDSKRENGFLSGVLLLSASTLIVKIIGLAYKIPMMSLLGAEGMGYFNSAYEIYALLCVISTAGLPVAVSILVSETEEAKNRRATRRIYRTAMTVFAVLGLLGTLAMLLFSHGFSVLIENPDAVPSIISIAPALLCVCISSAVRGYFQGRCRMSPTAVSQLIEALGKLFLGIIFAKYAINSGYPLPMAAAFAIFGISLGTLISALYLLILKFIDDRRDGGKPCESYSYRDGRILATLFKIAVPITLSSALLGVTRIIDMALIMRRLQDIGYSISAANSVYGAYTTLGLPIFSLVPSLITPISLALVPRLSGAIERGDPRAQNEISSLSLRMTVLFAMPASFGIAIYSTQILGLLFPTEESAVSMVAPLLALLGISIVFSCLITTTNAILQSYKQTGKPIISMALGALVKIISAYILIGMPSIGIYGAPLSTLFCNITITAVNIYFMNKSLPESESISRVYARPFLASCMMTAVSFAAYLSVTYWLDNSIIGFMVALVCALISYAFFAILFGAVSKEDAEMLPMGQKIILALNKIGFWRSEENKT